ncbi:polysaccharide pyruvyl transferase family protein [Nitrosophilus labii]|uniref:polysaccharide pyruvyl transferase family protein n=1 Tax=Nitrosophilus labii TaxID=2706014 RepID=UPI001656B653|nr:polysaccharide pyruvyl transferase family protein [Nitrosophilus labii]
MKKIGLIGYFGYGNFGDELFLEVHKQYLSKDYELEVVNDLLEEPYFSKPVNELVKQYDAFLIGGGDLINPIRISKLYWQLDFLQKPVFIFGIGVPNVKWSRKHVLEHYRKFFLHDNCKLIVARDIESYEWIKKNFNIGDKKLKWFPDPVCSYNRPSKKNVNEKYLGVVMRNHRSLQRDFTHVRKLIDEAKKMGYKIKHIVLSNKILGKGDYELAKELALIDEEIFYSESLTEMCEEISSCSLLASIKFHGMVVATMYGIPTIAMSVTPKNRNFLRMIERPEMLVSYTNENLYKRLSYYPTNIHSIVRGMLYRRSKEGYMYLKNTLQEII